MAQRSQSDSIVYDSDSGLSLDGIDLHVKMHDDMAREKKCEEIAEEVTGKHGESFNEAFNRVRFGGRGGQSPHGNQNLWSRTE